MSISSSSNFHRHGKKKHDCHQSNITWQWLSNYFTIFIMQQWLPIMQQTFLVKAKSPLLKQHVSLPFGIVTHCPLLLLVKRHINVQTNNHRRKTRLKQFITWLELNQSIIRERMKQLTEGHSKIWRGANKKASMTEIAEFDQTKC